MTNGYPFFNISSFSGLPKSDVLKYEISQPEPTPQPQKPQGGCGKKGVELFVSLMTASAVIGILLRKRK